MEDLERLVQLIRARHACITIITREEDESLELVRHAAVEAQRGMWLWSNSRGLRDGLMAGSEAVTGSEHPAAAITYLLGMRIPGVGVLVDLAGHLKDAKTLRLLRDLIAAQAANASTLIFIDHSDQFPDCIRDVATVFTLSLPDEKQLEILLRSTVRELNRQQPIEATLSPAELAMVIRNLSGLTSRQAQRIIRDVVLDDRRLDAQDINRILAEKRRLFQQIGLLEYVEAPVDLGEIGGLGGLKRWLSRRQLALSPEAAAFGIPAPRGVLMLGVQGAGKSLSAKAVATAWQRPLMRLDPSVLYDRYVGESEQRLRDTLRQAEAMAPIILWIDEIEKGFASAASQSTDGGLSKRMFGTLLTWMQEHVAPVFTVATANDIEALPPELLRKGRFDEVFFVDLPGISARACIFAIHLRKRGRDPQGFDLKALAKAADGYSGAEIEQAVIAALHEAFPERAQLTTQRLIDALQGSPPLSVTMAERVDALRAWARGRCVPAEDLEAEALDVASLVQPKPADGLRLRE